ncbi:hypothetical protein D5S18_00660 [Nocardia panacis]|uniref:LamG domain-containing protein n=1 Tax=Nocardia panacis TaxID=2340916 RepID=A0A3A4KIX7_9NOCA|nr:heparin lyase I family protein [Nocardia panacis]RJO79820.1 hypothetical protein D5S18_00660 [Nocardia panacis]
MAGSGKYGVAALLACGLLVAAGAPARAATVWTADPGRGAASFGPLDCETPGGVTVAQDPERGGVWQYRKPSGAKRCETRGISVDGTKYAFQNNATYYIGWWSKMSTLVDTYATFQWKSYGTGSTQNYPFVVATKNGRTTVFQRQPDNNGLTVWASAPIAADTWYHYVIGVHTSDEPTGGWIQLWFNGEPQTFTDGSPRYRCRTWDVDNDPKWGVYGAQATEFVNTVAAPKIGTTYEDVAN